MLRIGSIHLDSRYVMAPMAGITNLPFRLMVRRLGAGLVMTEMISAHGLCLGNEKTRSYLASHPEEKPVAFQLFGSDPRIMARACRMAVEAGADVVDINMGCPVKKVVKTGSGSALMRNPRAVAEIVTAVRVVCPVPLTAKIRAGWSPAQANARDVARIIEDCGADAVTIHPRFATQGFSGRADWSLIGEVKARAGIPVIGNGDVFNPEAALQMRERTGCDGVMVGRAAVGNPWIFGQIQQSEAGLPIRAPGLSERRDHIMTHFRLLSDSMGEGRAARTMRGLLLWYTKGLPNSSRFRGEINRIKDLDSLVRTMDAYFDSL